nr:MAG TPA: Protein of unknown function (DUF3789) [Caudoviricetes sp.]
MLLFIGGAIVGATVGVIVMCLLQINERDDE